MRSKPICLLLCLTVLLAGCTHVVSETRRTTVTVTTGPPGAEVWREDGLRRQHLGTAPVETTVTYEERARRWKPGAWIAPTVSLATLLAGGVLYASAPEPDPDAWLSFAGYEQRVGGFCLMVAGGVALLASAIALLWDGGAGKVISRTGEEPLFLATLPGHAPREARWQPSLAHDISEIHFTLPPAAPDAATSAPATPDAPLLVLSPLLVMLVGVDGTWDAPLMDHLRTRLTAQGYESVLEGEEAPTEAQRRRLLRSTVVPFHQETCQVRLELFRADDLKPLSRVQKLAPCGLEPLGQTLDRALDELLGETPLTP